MSQGRIDLPEICKVRLLSRAVYGARLLSARLGMPVEGGRPGECSAMRNVYDWLYAARRNCLDGKKQVWICPGVGPGAMQAKGVINRMRSNRLRSAIDPHTRFLLSTRIAGGSHGMPDAEAVLSRV